MKCNFWELEVLIHGKPAKEFSHNGDIWIEGRKGSEFSLLIRNNHWNKVLAVPSVDGLSVMDGQPAGPESRGYIIAPHSCITIPGWRLDLEKVAKFVFSSKGKSYASKSDQPKENVGVIGCIIHEEDRPAIINWLPQQQHHHHYHYPPYVWTQTASPTWTSSYTTATLRTCNFGGGGHSTCAGDIKGIQTYNNASACYFADSNPVQQELGTEFGEESNHSINEVDFKHKTEIMAMMAIYYDSQKGLEKRGISMKYKASVPKPQAFPGRFCQPPKK